MSLIDHLMKREKLDLAKELAKTARENATLRDEIGKRDVELFWMKVAERDPAAQQQAALAASGSEP
jgi:hypothetical protein